MAVNSQPKWSAVKPRLATLSQPDLIDLVKALFDQSAANKLLITTRLAPNTLGEDVLEPYKKQITTQFFPSRGLGKLNLREARQAIRDYRKATSDIGGTLELMMTYIETGIAFIREYGDISESFYNSLESVLDEIAQIFKSSEGQAFYPQFFRRLHALKDNADYIGYGSGDYVIEVINALEAALSED